MTALLSRLSRAIPGTHLFYRPGCSIRSTLYAYDENLMLDLRRRDAGLLRPYLPTVELVQPVQMLLVFNIYDRSCFLDVTTA